jgi:hypothetical protein
MTNIPMIPPAAWYADGMHWIGSLFQRAGADFDRPSFAPSPDQPRPEYLAPEEFLFDVRTRMLGHL